MRRYIETPTLGVVHQEDPWRSHQIPRSFRPFGYYAGAVAGCLARLVTRARPRESLPANPDPFRTTGDAFRYALAVYRFVPRPWLLLLYDARATCRRVRDALSTL